MHEAKYCEDKIAAGSYSFDLVETMVLEMAGLKVTARPGFARQYLPEMVGKIKMPARPGLAIAKVTDDEGNTIWRARFDWSVETGFDGSKEIFSGEKCARNLLDLLLWVRINKPGTLTN